ncbi:MAG: ribosome small subunit-dependent GTPase A [Polyangiaceae bacterium]
MDFPTSLAPLGWSDFFSSQIDPASPVGAPARVIAAHSESFEIAGEHGAGIAVPSGRLRSSTDSWPAVGDWVIVEPPPADGPTRILQVLERRTTLARQAPGRRTERQVIAANVDYAFVVTSFGADFSLGRLERYLAAIRAGGAAPVIVLSKLDLCAAPQGVISEAHSVAGDAPVIVTSSKTRFGFDELSAFDVPGSTLVCIGSSGVGKSSLLNGLLGAGVQSVLPVRESDGTGRHSTTARRMFCLPGGGLVIDTPGLRELALWATDADHELSTFADIQELAAQCAFSDCAHHDEPRCAVRAAVDSGELDERRLTSFHKLARELAYQASRQDANLERERRHRWRAIHKRNRQRKRILGR